MKRRYRTAYLNNTEREREGGTECKMARHRRTGGEWVRW